MQKTNVMERETLTNKLNNKFQNLLEFNIVQGV